MAPLDRLCALVVKHGFGLGLVVGATGLFLVGLVLVWRSDGPGIPDEHQAPRVRPEPRPRWAAASPGDEEAARREALEALAADAKQADVPLVAERFLTPFPTFRNEGRWQLGGRGGLLVTRELRLSTDQRVLTTPLGGLGTYRAEHVVLTIENRTEHTIAFRVDTTPSGRMPCSPKAFLPQSALVLGPREATSRTECLAKGRDTLAVGRVDVMVLPPLAYHYLVRIRPVILGLSPRVAEGHVLPPSLRLCAGVPRQVIEQALRSSGSAWFDVIDFYARHNCDRREIPPGYRRRGPEPEPSPVLETILSDGGGSSP